MTVDTLFIDDYVVHDTFGLGQVKEVSGQGDAAVVVAQFAQGAKRLLLRYAPLRRATWQDNEAARDAQRRRAEDEWQRRIAPLAKTEEVATQAWRVLLEPHFDIEEQVQGRHYTGKKLRMDMLLHPKFEWSGGGHHPIGFEIKKPLHTKSGALIGQAADYASSWWYSNRVSGGALDVFVAVYDDMAQQAPTAQVLGGIGVIYLGVDKWNGLTIRCSFNRMWSEKTGVVNNKWAAKRKYGSR